MKNDSTPVAWSASGDDMIFRSVRRGGFTHLPHEPLDAGLSLKELGLLWYMLSKPDGWRFASERIAKDVRDGRDGVRTALSGLEEAGYVLRISVGGTSPHKAVWVRDSLDVRWPSLDGVSGVGKSGVGKAYVGESNAGKAVPLVSTEEATTDEATTDKPKTEKVRRTRRRGDEAWGPGIGADPEAPPPEEEPPRRSARRESPLIKIFREEIALAAPERLNDQTQATTLLAAFSGMRAKLGYTDDDLSWLIKEFFKYEFSATATVPAWRQFLAKQDVLVGRRNRVKDLATAAASWEEEDEGA